MTSDPLAHHNASKPHSELGRDSQHLPNYKLLSTQGAKSVDAMFSSSP